MSVPFGFQMVDVATVFGLVTLVIFIGLLSTLLFERTRIPDILVLIALGIVFGPLPGILKPSEFAGLTELFGALALTLILFDGGLELNYSEVVRKFGNVFLLIAGSFTLTTATIAIASLLFFPSLPP